MCTSKVVKMFKSSVIIAICCLSFHQSSVLSTIIRAEDTNFVKDYQYVPELGAFYKIHAWAQSWYAAYQQCKLEGGSLFYPDSEDEAIQLINLISEYTSKYSYTWIGAHELFSPGIVVDLNGTEISEYYASWLQINPDYEETTEKCVAMYGYIRNIAKLPCERQQPFICKKYTNDVTFNEICGTSDIGYLPNKDLGSCYKIHNQPKSWSEAYATCHTEGSYLLVINDEQEANFIHMTVSPITHRLPGDFNRRWMSVGIHNLFLEGNFITIHGENMDKVYNNWLDGEPNNTSGKENCGSFDIAQENEPLLNDINCKDDKTIFVCERDIVRAEIQTTTTRTTDTYTYDYDYYRDI